MYDTVLDESASDAIAALCHRALDRPHTPEELRACLFAPDDPAIVRGDPAIGVVATVPGHLRLLVVDPDHQRQGHGSRLLDQAEIDAGDGPMTVGGDPPYYIAPGVESTQLGMLCLLEKRHYNRGEANFNMDVDLRNLPDDPGGPVLATEDDVDEVGAFLDSQWPNWKPEALRALRKGSLLIDRDDKGISGFCAWDVNQRGLLGPVAVRLDLFGKRTGGPLLVGALHRMRAAGQEQIEISWVGPIPPYAKVGGTIGRVFFVYRSPATRTKKADGQ